MDIDMVECKECKKEYVLDKRNFYFKKNGNLSSPKCKYCVLKERKKHSSNLNYSPVNDSTVYRKCYTCEEEKPYTDVYFNRKRTNKTGLTYRCRDCNNKKSSEYRKNNPDIEKNIFLKNKYGITLDDYNNMLKAQGSKCVICLISSEDYYAANNKKLAVDHCHITGKVRGLLCCQCNRSLGLLKENEESLRRAIKYLQDSK